MSDEGLSIFDERAGKKPAGADDATQVIPAVAPSSAGRPPATNPSQRPQAPAPAQRTASPAAAAPSAPSAPAAPSAISLPALPVVRRGGYDQQAVDNVVRQLAT